MRSKQTVMTAVTTKITASDRVERMIFRTVDDETIRKQVTISTPDSAASGICETGPVAR